MKVKAAAAAAAAAPDAAGSECLLYNGGVMHKRAQQAGLSGEGVAAVHHFV
jgi:hypothetical protein